LGRLGLDLILSRDFVPKWSQSEAGAARRMCVRADEEQQWGTGGVDAITRPSSTAGRWGSLAGEGRPTQAQAAAFSLGSRSVVPRHPSSSKSSVARVSSPADDAPAFGEEEVNRPPICAALLSRRHRHSLRRLSLSDRAESSSLARECPPGRQRGCRVAARSSGRRPRATACATYEADRREE